MSKADPPIEVYDKIDKVLLPKIMDYIEKNSDLKIDDSWYEAKTQIIAE